jgi:hypothetical protein
LDRLQGARGNAGITHASSPRMRTLPFLLLFLAGLGSTARANIYTASHPGSRAASHERSPVLRRTSMFRGHDAAFGIAYDPARERIAVRRDARGLVYTRVPKR